MIKTRIPRRILVRSVSIDRAERFLLIDLRLPANLSRITGVLVTSSATWANCGTVTFQASDRSDVFYVQEVSGAGVDLSDEHRLSIEDVMSDNDKPWVSGNVPRIQPVDVAVDNLLVRAWFKGQEFVDPFELKLYLHFEAAEELVDGSSDVTTERKSNCHD